MNNKFSTEFDNMVSNVKMVVREANHMDCSDVIIKKVAKVGEFLDALNYLKNFTINPVNYTRPRLLDVMDDLKNDLSQPCWNNLRNDGTKQHGYRVLNSVYDCIKDFYFSY